MSANRPQPDSLSHWNQILFLGAVRRFLSPLDCGSGRRSPAQAGGRQGVRDPPAGSHILHLCDNFARHFELGGGKT